MEDPRPDLSERAIALAPYLGREPGGFSRDDAGADLMAAWLREEVLPLERYELDADDIESVIDLVRDVYGLAGTVREIWGCAGGLSWLVKKVRKASDDDWTDLTIGTWAITWTRNDEGAITSRRVRVDENRSIPGSMRHWFERAGIYQSKAYGIHRQWRRHDFIHGSTNKARFASGTYDGKREFRVIPHLDRMDICDGYFDRWANSRAASVPMPRTQAEFEAALDRLVALSERRATDIARRIREDEAKAA